LLRGEWGTTSPRVRIREIQSARPLFWRPRSRKNGNKPCYPSPDGGERKGNKRSIRRRRTPARRWPVQWRARSSVGVVVVVVTQHAHSQFHGKKNWRGSLGFYISLNVLEYALLFPISYVLLLKFKIRSSRYNIGRMYNDVYLFLFLKIGSNDSLKTVTDGWPSSINYIFTSTITTTIYLSYVI